MRAREMCAQLSPMRVMNELSPDGTSACDICCVHDPVLSPSAAGDSATASSKRLGHP